MDSAGPGLLTFLITLARRTVTSGSGRPKPKSLEVAKSGKRKVATEQKNKDSEKENMISFLKQRLALTLIWNIYESRPGLFSI